MEHVDGANDAGTVDTLLGEQREFLAVGAVPGDVVLVSVGGVQVGELLRGQEGEGWCQKGGRRGLIGLEKGGEEG